jgi:hypothetical protein
MSVSMGGDATAGQMESGSLIAQHCAQASEARPVEGRGPDKRHRMMKHPGIFALAALAAATTIFAPGSPVLAHASFPLPVQFDRARVTVVFSTDAPTDIAFTLTPGNTSSEVQTANLSATFGPARTTVICIGPQNPPPANAACGTNPYNAVAKYVDLSAGAAGNLRRRTLTLWPGDPCPNPLICPGIHINVTNPKRATGG